jgi:glycosyltransferase involved in cell wall biosynthesis
MRSDSGRRPGPQGHQADGPGNGRKRVGLRILQVIHQFPPYSSQGSEVYCANLSRTLAATDEVRVFHLSHVPHTWRPKMRRETLDGLATYHCLDGGEYARLADYPNHFLRRSFETVLEEFRPEIVHFHHFLSLADDLVTVARASGAAVIYTLHDYGLICPNALLVRDDGALCGKQGPDFFQDCCPTLVRTIGRRRAAWWIARIPSLARWQLYARQQPVRLLRTLLFAATGQAARWLGDPRRAHVGRKRDFFLTHTRRLFRDVDLFLAPSEFLLRRYVSCGLPRAKIVFSRYGIRHFLSARRGERPGPVRFGYIGALHPQKGIELLLEAFRDVGHGASLHVFGSVFGSPISRNFWRRIRDRATPNVFFQGAYDNDRVGEILARVDVVVVPSMWYENSPLTIQEAFIAGLPVITADAGGMAELVRDGVDGLRFRFGDSADLGEKLRRVAGTPEILDRLRRGIPSVPTIEGHAADLRDRYRGLLRSPASTSRGEGGT